MKLKNYVPALIALMLTSGILAQKPDNQKYKGYYKNLPLYDLNISGYTFYTKGNDYVQNTIDKNNLKLELKGFSQGNDNTIVFSCSEPETMSSVKMEEKMVNNQKVVEYYMFITAKADSRIIFLDKDGKPYFTFTVEPKKENYQYTGFKRSKESEAKSDLKSFGDFDRTNVKNHYMTELFRAYQDELDKMFGQFAKEEKFQVFTIASKDLDYSDFNKASEDFMAATSTPEINTPENQAIIKNSIAVWSQYLSEYSQDKKAKVNDKNMDEIQFNITMGYLVLGDGEKYSEYWQKCLDTKGSNNAEASAKWFMPELVKNYQQRVANTGISPLTKSFISDKKQFENLIAVNGILNYALSRIAGNVYYINQYFAPDLTFIIEDKKTIKSVGSAMVEKLDSKYGDFATLLSAKYTLSGTEKNDTTLNLKVIYDEKDSCITRISNNDKSFLEFYYDDAKENIVGASFFINHHFRKFSFDYSTPGKIKITTYMLNNNNEKKDVNSNGRIEFADNMQMTAVFISPISTYEIKYDESGNIIQYSCSDPGDNRLDIPVTNELNEKGNVIKSTSRFNESTSSCIYMY